MDLKTLKQNYPMHAYDLSEARIQYAKKGIIGIAPIDKYFLKDYLGMPIGDLRNPDFAKLIKQDPKKKQILDAGKQDQLNEPYDETWTTRTYVLDRYDFYQIQSMFLQMVDFKQADVCEWVKHPLTKPAIVFCKNFLYHLPIQERAPFFKNLYSSLPSGSFVVLGEQDVRGGKEWMFPNLKRAGFNSLKEISQNQPVLTGKLETLNQQVTTLNRKGPSEQNPVNEVGELFWQKP